MAKISSGDPGSLATGPYPRAGSSEAWLTRLRVAFDVLPLSGELTGVGRFCAGLADALVRREEVELRAYAVARHAQSATTGPARAFGLSVRTWRLPTRVANAVWARADPPPIEWLVGPVDVVHGTNYVVPPARHAGRVVTVHDLTALRYPEMCVPASLAYPRLVARAARRGAFVHVPSGFVRDEVVAELGVVADRVKVVPYGVDGPGQITSSGPVAPGRARTAPYVLALGAVEPRKDLPTLVRAFAELASAHADLELVVAGPGDGESRRSQVLSRPRASGDESCASGTSKRPTAGRCCPVRSHSPTLVVRGVRLPAPRGDGGRRARGRDCCGCRARGGRRGRPARPPGRRERDGRGALEGHRRRSAAQGSSRRGIAGSGRSLGTRRPPP